MQTQAIDPYRRLIRSNERLQKLKMLHAPQILIDNENRIFGDVMSALLRVGETANVPVHFTRNDTVRDAFIKRSGYERSSQQTNA